MTNSNSPFYQIGAHFKTQPILPFQENTTLAKKYLGMIQGENVDQLFIGWICERDSFFAYLYKSMKKEARDDKSTKLASKIARAGFPVMLPKINKWILKNTLPVLIVPVPSRHGVSERFAAELYKMLDKNSKKASQVEEIFNRLDKLLEVKRIDSWAKRKRATYNLFSLKKRSNLNRYVVLLVDDIVTSGSSLRKCAGLLKQRGMKSVVAVSLTTNLFDRYSYKNKDQLKGL